MRRSASELFAIARTLVEWLLLSVPLGVAVGSACALFLCSLDAVTRLRWEHPGLLYALPLGGVFIVWIYGAFGGSSERGHNLILEEIEKPGGGVPLRMAPLVLMATLATHLFGGSAGREGTAVQMGGSIASSLARLFRLRHDRTIRTLLLASIAAGFSGVFGTPVAGAIFAMEVLAIGRLSNVAVLPCLIAAIVSDQTCIAWGIEHTHYSIASSRPDGFAGHLAPVQPGLLAKVALASVGFGLASAAFSKMNHGMHAGFRAWIRWPLARPIAGGLIIIGLTALLGTRDYLGLGVSSPDPHAVTIVRSFEPDGAHAWSWFWKLLFTAITLGSGFKGGEVTPLFFIGATLGNRLAGWLGAPVDLLAGLGFVAVFAGATNTPLACTVMAVELFGAEYTVYFAVACFVSYLFSGHTGIYLSQRIITSKTPHAESPESASLRDHRDTQRGTTPAGARFPAPASTLAAGAAFPPAMAEGTHDTNGEPHA